MYNTHQVKRKMKCVRDSKLVQEMVAKEKCCLADPNYLTLVQKGRITPLMRRIALDWIFEVSRRWIELN